MGGARPEKPSGSRCATVVVMVDVRALSDVDLVSEVAGGDRAALAELYERHAPVLFSRLDRRCADPGLVEEAVQDTFVAVWRSAGKFRGEGAVGAWIWGIAIRRLIGVLRRKPQPTVPFDPRSDSAVVSAEDQLLVGVEHGDLAGAMDRLSPELRLVLQATVLDGLTMKEAGVLLGIPTGTVKTRMSRARREMREALA
jgi:RNA polymerase sigma-70 factor (ECF subfamily)